MKKRPRLTTHDAAVALEVCPQRIFAKIKQGHFPGHSRCECGRSVMIPQEDIDNDIKLRGRKK